jgi:hypothetical protein
MGNYPWRRMNHKLANSMKMWKGNGNTTTKYFPWMDLGMMGPPEVACSRGKLVPHSDLGWGTISKEISLKMGTWNVRSHVNGQSRSYSENKLPSSRCHWRTEVKGVGRSRRTQLLDDLGMRYNDLDVMREEC